MWEVLIPSVISILKEHFDNIIMRITTWLLSFILCWLYIPIDMQDYLMENPLPGLPPYILLYLFYFVAATSFWQGFLIFWDIVDTIFHKCVNRQTVKPQADRVEVNHKQN